MTIQAIPLFKSWVPEWLVKVTMFIVLLPSLSLFFLPLSNINAAAGYYGIEPADVQYSVILFYAGYTSFFSLEKRFFSYLAAKEYFIIFTLIQITTSWLCYLTHSLGFLFILRFIQGMCLTSTANLALAIIYKRLKTERAREIGYSIYFGMLICMIPFNNFASGTLLDAFNFNIIYKCAMFSYVPSLLLLGAFMNNVRLNVKFPLYLLDWVSFVLYGTFICLVGYIAVYGQEYYWLEDKRILFSVIGIILMILAFVIRQLVLKRPYFKMEVFKYRNFLVGAVVLFTLYICRFTTGISTVFFSSVLGFDPISISHFNLFNILGNVIGVIVSCVLILQRRPIRLVWVYGFLLLLIYHVWMYFLFSTQAQVNTFFIPLMTHGIGVGMLMTPTIIFMISSAPANLGDTAAGICLFVRCFGFIASIGFMNFFELFWKSKHYNAFQDQLTRLNPVVKDILAKQAKALFKHGVNRAQATNITNRLLIKHIGAQNHLLYAMDYYETISWMILFTLILVALFPYISKTVIYLRKDQPAPF